MLIPIVLVHLLLVDLLTVGKGRRKLTISKQRLMTRVESNDLSISALYMYKTSLSIEEADWIFVIDRGGNLR